MEQAMSASEWSRRLDLDAIMTARFPAGNIRWTLRGCRCAQPFVVRYCAISVVLFVIMIGSNLIHQSRPHYKLIITPAP